ncbi:conserved Plasmodium protein, unknown function [Plasmodium gallinaceum]|uniref:Uncharacterized protein n=1 Tax=Plasmodium gallinaceum TaxID=5849 RepID=A0A1J1H0V0_PLAGA|nr:conserved Plasmodium protein, unknown function [Plasmodium gallinaceum]CRG98077.1 conserved Plasmodium protein, unknown function [Plasmodium gallinaceum]
MVIQIFSKKKNCKYVSYESEHILFLSSFQLAFALMFCIYCELYYLSIMNVGLLTTSLLHWNKPELGLRRSIDILMAIMNIIIHIIYSFQINIYCVLICFISTILVTTSYLIGKKFSYNSYSAIFHLFIHTTGNFTALTIYYYAKKKSINSL